MVSLSFVALFSGGCAATSRGPDRFQLAGRPAPYSVQVFVQEGGRWTPLGREHARLAAPCVVEVQGVDVAHVRVTYDEDSRACPPNGGADTPSALGANEARGAGQS